MQNSLEHIKNQVIACTKCDLCKTRKNAVPGKGSPNAKIFFIGEAPGRSEDNVGEPFVGSAGKILSEVLENAGILRSSVYITNIVKCRPPKNRVPNESEKEACGEYLEKELELINPKVICVMGNTAYHSLLDGGDVRTTPSVAGPSVTQRQGRKSTAEKGPRRYGKNGDREHGDPRAKQWIACLS